VSSAGAGLPLWVLAGFALAGVVLRWYVLQSPIGGLDADEATSSLVSRQILDGKWPAFIAPLERGGALLAYPRALVLALFGPNVVATKLIEVVVYAAACVLVWRVGRRIFGEREGQLAGAVMWVFSPAMVWESTKVMLYYTPALVLATLVLLICVRQYQGESMRDIAWLGFVVGLGVWIHPMVFYVAVPAVGWLVWQRPRLVREVWRAVPGVVVGALPWIIYSLRHDFSTLKQPPGALPTTYADRVEGFFSDLLPRALGLRHQYFGGWYLEPLSYVVYAALFVGLLIAVRRWHGARTMLLVVALAFPVLFAIPKNSYFVQEPRYAMVLMPVIALGIAYLICRLAAFVTFSWRSWLPVAAVGVLALVSLVSLRHVVVQSASQAHVDTLRPPSLDALWSQLGDEGVDVAYADYWIGFRMAYEDRYPLTIVPVTGYYLDLVKKAPAEGTDVALFYADSPLVAKWQGLLASHGMTSSVEVVDRFAIVRSSEKLPLAATLGVMELPG
jgi:4-amino-4-deoxy-L-arabinose transferase-like glycosyltransferase